MSNSEKKGEYIFFIDGKKYVSEKSKLTVEELRAFNSSVPSDFCFYIQVNGPEDDKLIEDFVDLTNKGVEKLYSAKPNTKNGFTEGGKFLPMMDTEYLNDKKYDYEEIIEGNVKSLIIRDYPLPQGKYNVDKVDLMIRIPNGYNDTRPDMFFCYPHLKFNNNIEPQATNGRINCNGRVWQQWSRHSNVGNDWRPGIDGIKSHLTKVSAALKKG